MLGQICTIPIFLLFPMFKIPTFGAWSTLQTFIHAKILFLNTFLQIESKSKNINVAKTFPNRPLVINNLSKVKSRIIQKSLQVGSENKCFID